jgi:hypothetical protein
LGAAVAEPQTIKVAVKAKIDRTTIMDMNFFLIFSSSLLEFTIEFSQHPLS